MPYEDSPAAQKAKMEALARMQRAADVRCGLAEVEHMLSNMPPTRASKWRALHGEMWVKDPCMRGFELDMVGGKVLLTAQDAASPWQQAAGIAAAATEMEAESQDAIMGDADGEVNLF